MKCPHCNVGIAEQITGTNPINCPAPYADRQGRTAPPENWNILFQRCPECLRHIIWAEQILNGQQTAYFLIHPKSRTRPLPAQVPDPYAPDFAEACKVLDDSPKASAALSRRCLQAVLREKALTKSKDLFDQIDEVVNSGKIPSHIADELHAVRNIGNFAAHPTKSTSTGAIVDVEPGEAEWNLDVLESLFDFYFVQPALSAARKAALSKKLTDAGKPQLK